MLGHGVNLPCETLLFAETTKFDGESRRDLLPWELAQIAGRAGRFGLVERGHVGVLTGIPWANADPEIVEEALQPHVVLPSGHLGYRIVDEARIRPRLSDLGVDDPRRLDAALAAWHRVATRAWAHEGWLAVESLSPIRGRLAAIQRRLDDRNRRLSIEDTWKLINAPVDEDNAELLSTLALALAGDTAQRSLLTFLLDPARLRDATLEEAEQAGRTASILRWFALQYPGVGGVTIERAAELEETAAARVVARLRLEVNAPTIGRCRTCGKTTRAVVPALRSLLRPPVRFGILAREEDQPGRARDRLQRRRPRRLSRRATIRFGPQIGASAMGATVYELDEGQSICPYHYEYGCEEWAIVLRGRPTLRHPNGEDVLEPGDVVCFPEGPEGAHKLTNDRARAVRVMLLSDKPSLAAAVYPDSGKIGIFPPGRGGHDHGPPRERRRLLRRRALDARSRR